MRSPFFAALGFASILALAAPAQAQDSERTYAFDAIQRADLAAAEARLLAQRAEEPNEPAVLINLAHVYAKTDRLDQAAALYAEVLNGENVLMATRDGSPAWSHDLARRAMDRTRSIVSR